MKRPVFVATAALALAAALSAFAFAHDMKDMKAGATPGSWKGEIVDVACYVPHGAKGAAHAACAKKCAQSGQPIALLTGDGDMLLLVADHDNGKPFEAAKGMAGGMAEVTGKMDSRGTMKIITVDSVKPAA